MDEEFTWEDADASGVKPGIQAIPPLPNIPEAPTQKEFAVLENKRNFDPMSEHLDQDIQFAKRIVSFSLSLVMIASLAYVGFVLFDGGELTGYRPGDGALEAQEVYEDMIQADKVSLSGKGVTVCIVDSGLNVNHQDLDNLQVEKWKDFVGSSNQPYDDHGHGTSLSLIHI